MHASPGLRFDAGLAALLVGVACAAAPDAGARPGGALRAEVLEAAVYVEADYDAVWDRLARAEGYAEWSSAPCLKLGPAPGDSVLFGTEERVVYCGRLLTIEKGVGLSHTFHFVHPDLEEPPSLVEIRIEEAGPAVLVALRHDCQGAPRTYATISEVGWTKSLSRLKSLLETGRAMPWPEDGP